MLADALGRPVRILLTPGQAGDVVQAAALLEGQRPRHVIADRGYDAAHLRDLIVDMGAQPVIPAIRTRKNPAPHDQDLYKLRNRIERLFARLKRFRRLATRYDRRAAHFLAAIQLVAALEWLR